MRFSLRLRPADEPSYSKEEQNTLKECLSSHPEVKSIVSITRHADGGYVAVIQVPANSAKQVVMHLTENGYKTGL